MITRHMELGRDAVAAAGVSGSAVRAIGVACGGPLDPDVFNPQLVPLRGRSHALRRAAPRPRPRE
jgi:hypothetical protein